MNVYFDEFKESSKILFKDFSSQIKEALIFEFPYKQMKEFLDKKKEELCNHESHFISSMSYCYKCEKKWSFK